MKSGPLKSTFDPKAFGDLAIKVEVKMLPKFFPWSQPYRPKLQVRTQTRLLPRSPKKSFHRQLRAEQSDPSQVPNALVLQFLANLTAAL